MQVVERAQARLDVRDRDGELGRGQRAGQRRIRVAVHENGIRTLGDNDRLERGQHRPNLGGVRSAADRQ